ncbi:MAG: hypothetical protein Q9217_003773 [Psora testacea]
MSDSLNVIALISGGKDSFFSMLHCIANGHKIIALANLFPPALASSKDHEINASQSPSLPENGQEQAQDLNSFMYQTAGHTLIPLYTNALGLPLYRQEITGTAINSLKYYHPQVPEPQTTSAGQLEVDETECLMPLLQKVIAAHPEANAVSSGAILSTYQRTRIESIAIRLKLVPLSYLWQYPSLPPPSPGGLLDDMAAVGFDVRLVKVASGGLDEGLLWCNLMDPSVRSKVQKAVKRFGGSVLGEGGEYETLLVDGPSPVWQRRIEVDEMNMYRCVEHGSGGSASLHFGAGNGQALAKYMKGESDWRKTLRNIGQWDKEFGHLNSLLTEDVKKRYSRLHQACGTSDLSVPIDPEWVVESGLSKVGSLLYISNLTSTEGGAAASEQMQGVNRELLDILNAMKRSTSDIVFATILLRSISTQFASVNRIYGQLFDKPNPPARVTVCTSMPPGVNVILSVVVDLAGREAREGLHVQSRSYWAPANIGPYSQAISVCYDSNVSLVHVAGQIPLVPAAMHVVQPDAIDKMGSSLVNQLWEFQQQACLSLQHLWRVGTYMGVGWWTGAVAYIAGGGDMQTKARIAHNTWRKVHERGLWERNEAEDNGLDPWDKMYGGLGSLAVKNEDRRALPDYAMLMPGNIASYVPGFFAIQVDELPRRCEIEWQSLGVARDAVSLTPISTAGGEAMNCVIPSANTSIAYISIRKSFLNESPSYVVDAVKSMKGHIFAILGTDELAGSHSMTVYTPRVDLLASFDAQVVPCRAVWGPQSEELEAGIVMHSNAPR